MKLKWKQDAVSPVIATILMVAITVVLAAVLYVMVIGMGSETGSADLPIGLSQQIRNDRNITVLFASVPQTALIDGSTVTLTSGGLPVAVNATLYYSNGTVACHYSNNTWDVSDNTLKFTTGMQMFISATKIKNGDKILMTGIGFGTTVMTIN